MASMTMCEKDVENLRRIMRHVKDVALGMDDLETMGIAHGTNPVPPFTATKPSLSFQVVNRESYVWLAC